jgi:Raf kinase inhibitor-like YbhB/YbcL family protein
MRCSVWTAGVLALALALGGCGGSSGGSSTSTVTVGTSAPAAFASSGPAVATIGHTPIAMSSFDRWLMVTTALNHLTNHGASVSKQELQHQALGFLITSQWVFAEAAARGLSVSEAAVRKRLNQIEGQRFHKPAEVKQYLSEADETMADLLLRVKLELLESAIAQRVSAAKHTAAARQTALASFQQSFDQRWKSVTSCASGYVMEDCKEDKSAPATSASQSARGASSQSASSQSAQSNASGEVPPSRPGALAVSSPAFAANGAIPTRYTCDGANISPPIQWQNVPAHTAELVLFVIDDGSGRESGIRWVVAGIDPSLAGVAAGSTPAGAVVGRNDSGSVGYGGICPARGQTHSIEIQLYALRKKIPLSSGFNPAVAELAYSHSELTSATTYATYKRQ